MCVIFRNFRIIFHCAAVCHTAAAAGLPGPARVALEWTAQKFSASVRSPWVCPTHSLAFSSRVRHLGRLLSSLIFLVKLKQIKILNECRGRWGRGWGPPSRRGCKWYPQPPIQVRKLVQISSANTPSEKKPASDQADSYAAALHWAGAPGRLGSYRMKPTSLKWNKNLKKFVKTQGHNLKMSFLRPNLWIGLGFWVKKQIILWFLTWNVLTIFFEKERQIFLDCELGLSIVAKGNERHIAIWRKKKIESSFFWAFKAQGTSGMIPM